MFDRSPCAHDLGQEASMTAERGGTGESVDEMVLAIAHLEAAISALARSSGDRSIEDPDAWMAGENAHRDAHRAVIALRGAMVDAHHDVSGRGDGHARHPVRA